MLSNVRTVPDFYPIAYLPRGVRLAGYGGDASDLPADVLQRFCDDVAAGRATVPAGRVFALDEIAEAHRVMEEGHSGASSSSFLDSQRSDTRNRLRYGGYRWIVVGPISC